MGTIMINADLLDREDLDIYAKMCCIVLARMAQESPQRPLSLGGLSKLMGCTARVAGKALEQLIDKGLLLEVPLLELPDPKGTPPRVRRKDRQSPAVKFEDFDKPKKNVKQQLETLRGFILEPATDGTLRIILNMADGDVERVRLAYQSAAATQISDNLETLMNILQQGEPEASPLKVVPPPESVPEASLEPETRQVLTQINQKRIAELYAKSKRKQ